MYCNGSMQECNKPRIFVKKVKTHTGLNVEIIGSVEEARLSMKVVVLYFKNKTNGFDF